MILNDGSVLPSIGLGTWRLAPNEARATVIEALRVGYRLVDCAAFYENEGNIGEALAEAMSSGYVRRCDLWITSKLWVTNMHPEDVSESLKKTLSDLHVDYVDLYLVHWPVAVKRGRAIPITSMDDLDVVPIAETWRALERLVEAGLTRRIGVSNFNERQLADLLSVARIRPVVNQVELNVLLQQPRLRAFCAENGIHVTSYRTLGGMTGTRLRELPEVIDIARRNEMTPSQVLLVWALLSDASVVPKSTSPVHLRENLAAATKHLSDADMATICRLDQGKHTTGSFFFAGRTAAEFWGDS